MWWLRIPDRGQAHTVEAFMAIALLMSGVLFALNATAVTPLSASTSNQHIQNQQRAVTNDLLAAAAENGSLRDAVLYWNHSRGQFYNASDGGYYTSGGPPNVFGAMLNRTFRADRIAFNVYVYYRDNSTFSRQTMVFMGSPSDNAVSASRVVTVYNDTTLTGPDGGVTLETATANDNFYAPDALTGNSLHNVLEVRIVVWRM